MKNQTIISILLLISFFLPWINLTILTLNGYEIPISYEKLKVVNDLFLKKDLDFLSISYIIYLIPIFSIFNIIKDLISSKEYFHSEFLFGFISVIIIYNLLNTLNEKSNLYLSFGFYLTAIFSIIGLMTYFIKRLLKHTSEAKIDLNISQKNNIVNENMTNDELDNNISEMLQKHNNMINKLKDLKQLLDTGILTQEEFTQQKTKVLNP